MDTPGLSLTVDSMESRCFKRAISLKVDKTTLEGSSRLKDQLSQDFTQLINISSAGGQIRVKEALESPRQITINLFEDTGQKMVATPTMEEAGLPLVDQSSKTKTSIHFNIEMVHYYE